MVVLWGVSELGENLGRAARINIISQRWSRGLDMIEELGRGEENTFKF